MWHERESELSNREAEEDVAGAEVAGLANG